jgi:hypothetical protein
MSVVEEFQAIHSEIEFKDSAKEIKPMFLSHQVATVLPQIKTFRRDSPI